MTYPMTLIPEFDFAPYRLSGTVYATLMNDPRSLHELGDAMRVAPYKAPPNAPVLYLKPRNTLASSGDALVLPSGAPALEVGASLGLVIGRTACRVAKTDALTFVAGLAIVNDVRLPHDSYYRPSLRLNARDGFCPVGSAVDVRAIADADSLEIRLFVDGKLAQTATTSGRVRQVAELLSAVTDFMTLRPGDILTLGASAGAPLVRVGQRVAIEIDGLGRLENLVVSEESAA
jgi:5-oxopent-3-ene-1,2,5-tricarboxylate decarboxylase/2-hydroxyhepta-2,4-diene-1,7-dioate isomerase